MAIVIQVYHELTEPLLGVLARLEQLVFSDPYPAEKLAREASSKHNFLLLIAEAGGVPCGYKAGYEMTSKIFYSWIGGVVPGYRGQGVARALMTEQHALVAKLGYQSVRTYTENKYREMLILNIKSGFDVIGVFQGVNDGRQKIMLEKALR